MKADDHNSRQRNMDLRAVAGEHVVYVVPQESLRSVVNTEPSMLDLLRVIWLSRWLFVGIIAICTIASAGYYLLAPRWYEAEVLLSPADDDAAGGLLGGQLSGIAGLVGLAGAGADGTNTVEALAVLRSRDFTEAFITDNELIPVLFRNKWDEEAGAWMSKDQSDWPDIRDAVKYFGEKIRTVREDNETGLVALRIRWIDAHMAARWADDLATRLNGRMRTRAIAEATTNVRYLEEALKATNVGTLRESIGSVLEVELQKLMLAKGKTEFAFTVIDSADIPKEPAAPKPALTLVLGGLLGVALAMLVVLLRHFWARVGAAPVESAG